MLVAMSTPTTYKVHLVQRDGTITAGSYASADEELPNIGDEISVDDTLDHPYVRNQLSPDETAAAEPLEDHGHRARVTDLNPGDPVPIHAELLD
jgi:hypothetical protein